MLRVALRARAGLARAPGAQTAQLTVRRVRTLWRVNRVVYLPRTNWRR